MKTNIRVTDQTGTNTDIAVNQDGVCIPSVGDTVAYSAGSSKVQSRTFQYLGVAGGDVTLQVILNVVLAPKTVAAYDLKANRAS